MQTDNPQVIWAIPPNRPALHSQSIGEDHHGNWLFKSPAGKSAWVFSPYPRHTWVFPPLLLWKTLLSSLLNVPGFILHVSSQVERFLAQISPVSNFRIFFLVFLFSLRGFLSKVYL